MLYCVEGAPVKLSKKLSKKLNKKLNKKLSKKLNKKHRGIEYNKSINMSSKTCSQYVRVKRNNQTIFLHVEPTDSFALVKEKLGSVRSL